MPCLIVSTYMIDWFTMYELKELGILLYQIES